MKNSLNFEKLKKVVLILFAFKLNYCTKNFGWPYFCLFACFKSFCGVGRFGLERSCLIETWGCFIGQYSIFPKQSREKKACSFILSLCLTKKVFSRMYKEKKIFKKNRKMSVDAVFKEVLSHQNEGGRARINDIL